MRWTLVLFALVAALLAAPDPALVERGRKLFFDTQGLEYASCAHCHSLIPEAEEAEKAKHLGPGGTLWGSAVREGWRNLNTYENVGEALQPCARWWQKRKRGFEASDVEALVAFLKTEGPDEGALPKREVERRPKLLEDFGGGDAAKGKKLAVRYCNGCHNEADDAISFELRPGKKRTYQIARKVRGYDAKRKFKPKKHSMSYYTTDRLSDEDLRHILAYLGR